MGKWFRVGSICVLVFLSGTLQGQISYGGKPMMNKEDFEASRVLYLLEPEDQVYVAGLKSAARNLSKKALHYATERPVDLSPENNGQWTEKNGIQVWRVHLISPGAYSLGVYFSEFELNSNSRVFIYDPEGEEIKGGFTWKNNKEFGSFSVGHIPGEEIVIELQVNRSDRAYGKLRIAALSHAFLPVYAKKNILDTGLGTAQECEIDINCEEGENYQIIKRSVCHISTGTLLCTGVLVNNTDYNGKPYVLTAEHCINKEFRAQSSVFYFNYENGECGVNDAKKNQSISGSTLKATGDSLDFSIVELSERAPAEYNVYYAGWDARPQNHDLAVTIHHPNADAKKISFELAGTVDATYVTGDLNDYVVASNYRIRQWDIGTTEGGSSGCPLFNSSKRLIGNLSGGLAACGDYIGDDPITGKAIYGTNGNEDDFFSKISFNWDYYSDVNKQLKHWLDPSGSGQLSIGGLNGNSVDVPAFDTNRNLISVYPNPSNGSFFLDLPDYSGDDLTLSIYDLTGKQLYQEVQEALFPVRVNLGKDFKGIYLLRIEGKSIHSSGRIIVK